MDKDKAVQIGKMLLNPEELKIKVTYNGEIFVLHYPNPMEKAQIETEIARTLNGLPRSSYPNEHLYLVEATAYVNNLLIPEESPSWFKSAWTCYDEVLLATLYGEYVRFRDRFRERFADNGLQGSSSKK